MIVCSCNYITDKEIHDAVDGLMLANPINGLTPGKVYKSIGSRPNCGSCLSHAADLIHKRAAHLRGGHVCACEDEASAASSEENNDARFALNCRANALSNTKPNNVETKHPHRGRL